MSHSTPDGERLKIFTWHIHGTYLFYLSQGNFTIYIPVNDKRDEGYYGLGRTFPFGTNVVEVRAEEVRNLSFDCILFQTARNFLADQYEILSEEQRRLPRIFLEHDPPTRHPADALHAMNDPEVLMVHVTHYNKLMWRNSSRNVQVIEHGVPSLPYGYTGDLQKGIVVINNLHQRGRMLGADIFKEVSRQVPLDLVGMGTRENGGLGEVLHAQLPAFIGRYRFFFNPIRYTSLGLAVCEAMMLGMPVIALATTEYPTVLRDGETGYIHNDIDYLVLCMNKLLRDRDLAMAMGARAREVAQDKFDLKRFTEKWEDTFRSAYKMLRHEENSIHQ